ncbi:MAG: ATP-binding protein [Candidatus Nanoarchaeia archaeon]
MDKIKILIGNLISDFQNQKKQTPVLIPVQELLTGRTCIIAQSGAGKSWLIGLLCEQLCKSGFGFCIVDTEGEYFSLKEKFDVLWIGNADFGKNNLDIDLDMQKLLGNKTEFLKFVRAVIDKSIPVIYDVSEILDAKAAVRDLASALFSAATELRKPYLLILEEADKFASQSKDCLKEIEEISKRGRKRGLGLLIATQRPSLVNKNILSQCGNQIIGKLSIENDLRAVDLFFASRKELEELPKLNPGEFFVTGFGFGEKIKIKSAERETPHKGLTPNIEYVESSKNVKIGQKIDELKKKFVKEFGEFKSEFKSEFRKENISCLMISTKINEVDAKKIAEKLRKKDFLWKAGERLEHLTLIGLPLAFVEVKIKEGHIIKKLKTYSFIINCENGDLVSIPLKTLLKSSRGFGVAINFNEAELKVLLALKKPATIAQLAKKVEFSEEKTRAVVKSLREKKAITEIKKANFVLWSSLVDLKLPNIKKEAKINFELSKPSPTLTKISPVIEERTLRQVIKAMWPLSEITRFEIFYYPVWEAVFENRKRRKVRIDALTGHILK